jgi:SAM-dependent methyltransferase
MNTYIFENAGQPTSQRFSSLERLYDPWTIHHLEVTGIGPGWQCWEVGGGGGSIAAWLAERCGQAGHVLVTDLDPRFLVENASLDHAHIEIGRHDIGTDPLPAQLFDLIHARLVLIHIPAREVALQRMVTALKPGGWLIVEDFDATLIDPGYPTTDAAVVALYQHMLAAQGRLMAVRGGDLALSWGRSLYRRLRAHGLVNLGMEGYVAVWQGQSEGARLVGANFEQIREEAASAGLITHEEIAQVLTLLSDPNFAFSAPVMFTAWGCRP